MLRVERAIYLSLTLLAVFVYWRSFVFVFRWLPIVYCGGATQTFFDWYSLLVIAPVIPFVGFFMALLLARRSVLTIVRGIVAALSAVAAAVIARIFGDMMTPGAWGDCICCGSPTPMGPRDIHPPLVLQLSPNVRSALAIAVLVVMSVATLAMAIAELRGDEKRIRYLALSAASLLVFFCAGWLITRAPYFIRWDDLWRYVVAMNAIASIACVISGVTMARKSIGAFAAAVLMIVLSYTAIYHAVGFFAMVAA